MLQRQGYVLILVKRYCYCMNLANHIAACLRQIVHDLPLSGSASNVISSGGYAIPFPRQQQPTTGTMPAMMVTQATSPISPSSPLIAASSAAGRARSAAAAAMDAKESDEDELESLTSNEAMLESGSVIKEAAKVRYCKLRDGSIRILYFFQ